MRTLLRVAVSATFLFGATALGAFAISEPAYPQGSAHAKAEPNVTPEARPRCGMDFSAVAILPGWRILEGDKLQAYLETAFTPVPDGDALAYFRRGDKVALVLGRDGCVVGRRVMPAKAHRKLIELALGRIA